MSDNLDMENKIQLTVNEIESLLPEFAVGKNDSHHWVYINNSEALSRSVVEKLRAQREALLKAAK